MINLSGRKTLETFPAKRTLDVWQQSNHIDIFNMFDTLRQDKDDVDVDMPK